MDASGGEYATAVPLVWKDMIFIGKAGGDLGIRGEMMAFRAADGTQDMGLSHHSWPRRDGIRNMEEPRQHRAWRRRTWTSYSLDPRNRLAPDTRRQCGPRF